VFVFHVISTGFLLVPCGVHALSYPAKAVAHLSESKSFMHDLLEHPDGDVPNWEQIVRETAAVAFGGEIRSVCIRKSII
jgi:hypothetical protein